MPLSEGERLVRQHLLRVLASGEHGPQLAGALVGFVEGEVVVWDQLPDRLGHALEQCIEALLRQNVVKDVCQTPVRLDECDRAGAVRVLGVRGVRVGLFDIGHRVHDPASSSAPARRSLSH